MSHHGREAIGKPLPLHATWRTRKDVCSLRGKRLFRQIRESFRRCCEKPGFRVTHFSVAGSYLHLIVEADATEALSRGMQGLGVSVAKRINFASRRRGPAFDDRFYAYPLATVRDVRRAFDYVLHQAAAGLHRRGMPIPRRPDPFTSEAAYDAPLPLTRVPRTALLRAVAPLPPLAFIRAELRRSG
jgi:REP element-mobilizing transposase RayT